MKVYIVTNQSLYADSSYFDVVEVCSSIMDAEDVVKTAVEDVLANGLLGENNPKVYFDYDIPEEFNNSWGCLIHEEETGFYENFRIEEKEVKPKK